MLIGFIGAPCSGKTTTAARLFAELKDNGVSAEFIVEEARMYIANLRLHCRKFGIPFTLSDMDQWNICNNQSESELTMVRSSPKSVVVSDSSVLNSALYMTPIYYTSEPVRNIMTKAIERYDLLFLCAPVELPSHQDPNRVHDAKQIAEVQEKIYKIVEDYGISAPKLVHLGGNTNVRLVSALSAVYERMKSC